MTQVQFLHKEIISHGEGMESWSLDCPDRTCSLGQSPLYDDSPGHTFLLCSAREVVGLYPTPPHLTLNKKNLFVDSAYWCPK